MQGAKGKIHLGSGQEQLAGAGMLSAATSHAQHRQVTVGLKKTINKSLGPNSTEHGFSSISTWEVEPM